MIGIITGIASGLLGHQTDEIFRKMEGGNTPPSWLLMSRYGVGTFLVIGTLITMLEDENGRQDVALKALAAAVAVGAGVAAGHLIDYLRE